MKRTLTASDISLGRGTEICQILGVAESDLHYLTPGQEKFFAENPSYLHYLLALHNDRTTPAELEKIRGLTKQSTQKILIVADRVDSDRYSGIHDL